MEQYATNFTPSILHEILKALLFINDFDEGSAKASLEQLVCIVMGQIESEKETNARSSRTQSQPSIPVQQQINGNLLVHTIPSMDDFAKNIVDGLIHDVVTSVEIASVNDHALNCSKVQ